MVTTGFFLQIWSRIPTLANAVNFNTLGLSSESKTKVKLRQQYISTFDNFEDETICTKSENSNRLFFKGDEKINDELSENSNNNTQQESINNIKTDNLKNIQNVSYYLGFCCLIYIKHIYFQGELNLNYPIPKLDISQISIKDKIPISINGSASYLADKFVLKLRAGSMVNWNEAAVLGLVVILAIYGPEPIQAFLNKANPRVPKISTLGPEGYNIFSYPTQKNKNSYLSTTNTVDQCSTPEFDMKKEYRNFMQEISKKGYELECSQERFNELSTNPQTGSIDEKSLIEAKGGLQGEAEGMYTNIRRSSNKAVDLDFEIDSSKGYTHVDYKTPIDFQDLADNKGIDISNFPSLETVAYNMGKKIPSQKEEFCGLTGSPKSPENVLHVVNLDLIRDSNQKQNMIDSVLKGAENKSDNTAGIYFLNYL